MDPATRIHPRLEQHRDEIGTALGLDDPTELTAALEDLQTLLVRCGYHLRFLRSEQALKRMRRSAPAARPTSAKSPPRRGRPPGSANWAQRQLALGLAEIWRTHSGRNPSRTHDPLLVREVGRYHAFVTLLAGLLPTKLLRTRKGHVPAVDHLVRIGISEFKDAQASSDESRRRGLIETHRWSARDDHKSR